MVWVIVAGQIVLQTALVYWFSRKCKDYTRDNTRDMGITITGIVLLMFLSIGLQYGLT